MPALPALTLSAAFAALAAPALFAGTEGAPLGCDAEVAPPAKTFPLARPVFFCLLRLLVQSGKHRRLARGHALTGTALSSAARRAGLTSPVRTRRNCRAAAIAALKVITSHKEILAIESQ